ncbi:MAG: hypothetical protein RI947_1156 [Candidatus Parcubacteria bacterium]|jgi:PTH1 family peptidyl-tRNA hydrolase
MKLIVGLGNPGAQYEHTRHNVGHMYVDYLAQFLASDTQNIHTQFAVQKSFDASVLEIRTNRVKILLAKPVTFMNRSGAAVRKLRDFYKIADSDIVVVHDDLDITLGLFKIQLARGPKVHNGIASVEQSLGTNEFWRVRIGVENRPKEYKMSGEAYVLQNFKTEEREKAHHAFEEISNRLKKEQLTEL